jgi:hypothetical protein
MRFKLPDEDKLLQVIGLREHAKPSVLDSTFYALRDLTKRMKEYADKLETTPQKKMA